MIGCFRRIVLSLVALVALLVPTSASAQLRLDNPPKVFNADNLVIDLDATGGTAPYRVVIRFGKVDLEQPIDMEKVVDSEAMHEAALADPYFRDTPIEDGPGVREKQFEEAFGRKPVAGVLQLNVRVIIIDKEKKRSEQRYQPYVELTPEMTASLSTYRREHQEQERKEQEAAQQREREEREAERQAEKADEARDARRDRVKREQDDVLKMKSNLIVMGSVFGVILFIFGTGYFLVTDPLVLGSANESDEANADADAQSEAAKPFSLMGAAWFAFNTLFLGAAFGLPVMILARPMFHDLVPGSEMLPLNVVTMCAIAPLLLIRGWLVLVFEFKRRGSLVYRELGLLAVFLVAAIIGYVILAKFVLG